MKALWVTSSPVADSPKDRASSFGGWVQAAFDGLAGKGGLELSLCSRANTDAVSRRTGDFATHYAVPDHLDEGAFRQILADTAPDLVHVHGTEYSNAQVAISSAGQCGIPALVSIQGFMSAYSDQFYHGIPAWARYGFTPRDIARRENTWLMKRRFARQGAQEKIAISQAAAVIGRTAWDRACVGTINPNIPYYECNESLRDVFYKASWDGSLCDDPILFVSQGSYPLKGLHKVLEALPFILDRFPKTQLVVAGHDPTHRASPTSALRRGAYGEYLTRLIAKEQIAPHVRFTGVLDEHAMLQQYLRTSVFVLPSAVENSPNSLAEAMLLGVPSVAAYVGGVPSLAPPGTVAHYPTADHRALAWQVINLLQDRNTATAMGQLARKHALITHDRERNTARLISIYREVTRK